MDLHASFPLVTDIQVHVTDIKGHIVILLPRSLLWIVEKEQLRELALCDFSSSSSHKPPFSLDRRPRMFSICGVGRDDRSATGVSRMSLGIVSHQHNDITSS